MTINEQDLFYGIIYLLGALALAYLVWSNREKFLKFDLSMLDDITSRLIQIGIAFSIASILVAALLVPLGWSIKISVLGAQELAYIAGAFWLVQKAMK